MSRECVLPSWAKLLGPGKVEVLTEQCISEILAELWADETWDSNDDSLNKGEITQYWLKIANGIMKKEIKACISGTDAMPEGYAALSILGRSEPDKKYAMAKYPSGEEVKKATKKEIDRHYNRVRRILE